MGENINEHHKTAKNFFQSVPLMPVSSLSKRIFAKKTPGKKKSVLIAQLTRVKIAFTMWISELCLNLI